MFSLVTKSHVAILEIQRPAKFNALTLAMWKKFAELVSNISKDGDIRALILRGEGKNFCAGADINEFDEVRKDADSALAYEAANSAAFAAIRNCPYPTIAAIKGVCLGGGFGIAAACDLRIGEPNSRFCIPPAKLGLAYPVDAMADIVNAIGPQKAKFLAYTANIIDANEALQSGFLLDVIEDKSLFSHCEQLAQTISALAPMSNQATKASVAAMLSGKNHDYEHANSIGNSTFTSADYAEGRDAFREKRKPVFKGR